MNLGVFSGIHGTPYTYVLPSVATASYNQTGYGPNGAGGNFQNNKVLTIQQCLINWLYLFWSPELISNTEKINLEKAVRQNGHACVFKPFT